MTQPEFSRPVRIDTLGPEPKRFELEADLRERTALARRFGLAAIERLSAEASLALRDDTVSGAGMLTADVTQECVVTGDPIHAHVEAEFEFCFRPQPEGGRKDEEIELDKAELDTIFYEGGTIDIGEAVADTLLLNLDPYPRSPEAEHALKAAGVKSEGEAGPFAALAGLNEKLKRR